MEKYGRAEEVDTAATGIVEDPTKVKIDKYGTAEEEYITKEHLEAYEEFVRNVQKKYNLSPEEAQKKAQELIVDYQKRERKARRKAMKEGKGLYF